MSSAEELLADLEEDFPVHDHNVSDPDNYFVIDPDTRQISNLSQSPNVLMQNDHNSEVYTFEIPRFVEGHDMLSCDRVRLHYINVEQSSSRKYKDVYEMSDLRVNPKDTSTLISTWTIKRQATQYVGNLSFVIQYICVDETMTGENVSNISYEWHTDIYKDIAIRETINNSEAAVIEYTDILEEWYQLLFGMEDSLVARVVEAADEQKAAIELKGETVLASIPEDYTTTHNMADEALRKKANVIEETAAGKAILVNDSADAYLLGLNLYGKTTQVTTTGKNLLNDTAFVDGISQGVRVSKRTDGGYNVVGTSSADTVAIVRLGEVVLTAGTKYAISGAVTDIRLTLRDETMGVVYADDTGSGTSYTPSTNMTAYLYVRVEKGMSVAAVFYPMVRLASNTDTTWEPYCYGAASPSPEYPQPLVSASGVTTAVSGSNLAYFGDVLKDPKKVNGVTSVLLPDGRISVTGSPTVTGIIDTIHAAMLTGDTLIRGAKYQSENCSMQVKYINGNTVWLRNVIATDDVVSINAYVQPRSDYFGTGLTFEPMMWVNGLKPAKFIPGSVTNAVPIERTLRGIPVSQNGNYTDENGQQWVCDEIDFERGVYIQRIVTIVCNKLSVNAGDTFTKVAPLRGESTVPLRGKTSGEMLCPITKRYEYNRNDGVHMYTEGTAAWVFVPADYDYVNNPPEVLAAVEHPIEKSLTDEEIAYYKRLKSSYHNTSIVNSAEAHMVVKYSADTKMFFENNSISDEQVRSAIDAYLKSNPITSGSTATIGTVELFASKWVSRGTNWYSQVVDIAGVTKNSQVDLTPSVEQLVVFYEKELTFVTENENGVVTVYAIGQKPSNDYTVQVTITEVSV